MEPKVKWAAEHAEELKRRVGELRDWFDYALEVCELRDEKTVNAACGALMAWADVKWSRGEGDTFGPLTHAWECVSEVALGSVESPAAMPTYFPLPGSPPWHPIEVTLVVGLVCSMAATVLLEDPAWDEPAIVAMLYADAGQARARWLSLRGHGRCRNSETELGRALKQAKTAIKEHELSLARRADSRKAAKAKHAKDPKQIAKAKARKLWLEREAAMHPRLGTVAQYATEVMKRWPELKSAKVIEQWSAQWSKEARAEKKSRR